MKKSTTIWCFNFLCLAKVQIEKIGSGIFLWRRNWRCSMYPIRRNIFFKAAAITLLASTFGGLTACSLPVRVSGVVFELDDAGLFGDPIPGVIVTYTRQDVSTPVTYNDTTLSPSGFYSVDIYQGSYIVQLVHPDYTASDPIDPNFAGTWEKTFEVEGVDSYTFNLGMVPR